MLPLSTVESPSFRKLINALSSTPVQLPNRRSLSSYLEKAFELMIKKVKEALDGVDRVSTTADVWMAHHKSYLGILETICKKTKATVPKLSPMTTGLAYAVHSAVKQ